MQCPFLKEALVESCRHATLRKAILRNPDQASGDRCTSARFVECAVYRAEPNEPANSATTCPFYQESLMQYCGAAAVTRYIPYSEAILSRCGTDSFRYCDLYLAMAHPDCADVPRAGGIMVPPWLWYAPNHMWIDAGEDGSCHVGIDGLLAHALGGVERISFVGAQGVCRPAVTLTVRGIDITLVFPNPMLVTASNVYLRANPAKVTSDPYRLGWLFEGKQSPDGAIFEGLTRGDEAPAWMEGELDRVSRFVHSQIARQDCFVADGGTLAAGIVRHLDRDQVLELFHRFFSPWTR